MNNFEPLVERTYYPYINVMTVTESLLSPLLTELANLLPALYIRKASWVEKESPVQGRVKGSCLSSRQLVTERQPEMQLSLSCASAKSE